jgi:hypothetical protein
LFNCTKKKKHPINSLTGVDLMKCVVVFTWKKMAYPNFDRGDNFNSFCPKKCRPQYISAQKMLTLITKENRLIPPCRCSRNIHNRAFQIESCRIDIRKMSLFPRTVRDWNLLPPDIVELDTPEAFKARIVSLYWV